jgi:hypothetical protein
MSQQQAQQRRLGAQALAHVRAGGVRAARSGREQQQRLGNWPWQGGAGAADVFRRTQNTRPVWRWVREGREGA